MNRVRNIIMQHFESKMALSMVGSSRDLITTRGYCNKRFKSAHVVVLGNSIDSGGLRVNCVGRCLDTA